MIRIVGVGDMLSLNMPQQDEAGSNLAHVSRVLRSGRVVVSSPVPKLSTRRHTRRVLATEQLPVTIAYDINDECGQVSNNIDATTILN